MIRILTDSLGKESVILIKKIIVTYLFLKTLGP